MYGGLERRLDPRVDAQIVLEVLPSPSTGERPVRLMTRNVSSSGASCLAPVPLPLNSLLSCRLLLPDAPEEGIATDVIVLRVEDRRPGSASFTVALYFVEMRPEDREQIRRFVFDRLGLERRRLQPAANDKP